jgi:murein DD-endopeptidase MepM/ murein hydrolase activator NlpD
MRIARVTFAFFSIGFLAGSFEGAAGLGHVEGLQAVRDRHASAGAGMVIIRSTANSMAVLASFGDGLPGELSARPLSSPELPDAVAAALSELARDFDENPMLPVVHAPQESSELAKTAPLDPDLWRPRFGAKRPLSEPDRLPFSRMPAPMSFALGGPFDEEPEARPDRAAQNGGAPEFIMPFERGRVTSLFNQGRYHPAIDLAGRLGSPVHATTRRQRVIFTGWRNGYGNTVVTRDDAGRMHLYAHLQRIVTKVGTVLEQGLMLGTLGSTGRSTGPHVHYEVKSRAGAHINPVTLLFPGRRVGRGYAWNSARSTTRVATRGR